LHETSVRIFVVTSLMLTAENRPKSEFYHFETLCTIDVHTLGVEFVGGHHNHCHTVGVATATH